MLIVDAFGILYINDPGDDLFTGLVLGRLSIGDEGG